jgi:cytochrome c biogenesis protein CcmG, thiol:disulfide interchange protein DsbE
MLMINIGETSQVISTFMQANDYDFPVLFDTNAALARQYGVSGIPVTFFIGRDGIIKYIKRGQFLSLNELQNSLNKIP